VHQVHQIRALDAKRTHIGNHAAKFIGLISNRVLKRGKARDGLFRIDGNFAPEHIELNIHAQQGLQDTVMDFTGDAAAFSLDSMGPDMPKEEQILERLREVPYNPFRPV
jgi:hypothetical protein